MKDLVFKPQALQDLEWWIKQNRKVALRILSLLREIQQTPFHGRGKPELLRHQYAGCWSRRIDQVNRIVYQVETDKIIVHACKGHYQ